MFCILLFAVLVIDLLLQLYIPVERNKKNPTVTTKLTPEPAQMQAPVPWKDKHTHKKLNTIPKCNNEQNKLQQAMQTSKKHWKQQHSYDEKLFISFHVLQKAEKMHIIKHSFYIHIHTQSKTNKVLFKSNLAHCV